jgi:hypothetical protein
MARGSATRLAYVRHKSVVVEIDVVETEIAPVSVAGSERERAVEMPREQPLQPSRICKLHMS